MLNNYSRYYKISSFQLFTHFFLWVCMPNTVLNRSIIHNLQKLINVSMQFCGEFMPFETADCKLGWWNSPAVSSLLGSVMLPTDMSVFYHIFFQNAHFKSIFIFYLKKNSSKILEYMKLVAYLPNSMNKIKMPRLCNHVVMKCAISIFYA